MYIILNYNWQFIDTYIFLFQFFQFIMTDIINKILSLIEKHPKYSKVVGFLLVALSVIYLSMQFSSCSLVKPSVENNQLGVEGVVSKEKNVSRTTKWYYTEPSYEY